MTVDKVLEIARLMAAWGIAWLRKLEVKIIGNLGGVDYGAPSEDAKFQLSLYFAVGATVL